MAMSESNRSAIIGIFEDQAQADLAMNDLRTAGFSNDQVNMEVRSASIGDENISADEQGTETAEGYTAAGITPGVLTNKTQLSRTVVTVQAPGREQEALGILHRNGANNANVPDALEADIAPILGTETGDTRPQPEPVVDAGSNDTFFTGQGTTSEGGTPPSP